MSRTGAARTSVEHPQEHLQQHEHSRDTSPLVSSIAAQRGLGTLSEKRSDEARFKLAAAILIVCILSFVLQTELTKFVQSSMGYQKPYFILYISHSFWLVIFPIQVFYTAYCTPGFPSASFKDRVAYFSGVILQSTNELYRKSDDYMPVASEDHDCTQRETLSSQAPSFSHRRSHHSSRSSFTSHGASASVAISSTAAAALSGSGSGSGSGTASSAPSSRRIGDAGAGTFRERKVLGWHLFQLAFTMTTLFMVPSYLWYTCVALTSMANLTAIYNTSCFFAYLFSIFILKERVVINKVIAVFLSLMGVALISIMSQNQEANPSHGGDKAVEDQHTGLLAGLQSSVSIWGDMLALIGAALYGLEEVIYKKYAAPKSNSITFANTLTGLMGVTTLLFFWVPIPLLHYMGIETFQLPTLSEFLSILLIATLGLVYNGCFMIVVSQTSPVFAAVGVMATIPLVAVVDLLLFGVPVGWGNIVGGCCILVGFGILVRENHNQNIQAH